MALNLAKTNAISLESKPKPKPQTQNSKRDSIELTDLVCNNGSPLNFQTIYWIVNLGTNIIFVLFIRFYELGVLHIDSKGP